MWEALFSQGTAPWALAAGFVTVHSLFLTRPVVKLWRDCEKDKKSLRDEHAEMRAQIVTMAERIARIENGGKTHE